MKRFFILLNIVISHFSHELQLHINYLRVRQMWGDVPPIILRSLLK